MLVSVATIIHGFNGGVQIQARSLSELDRECILGKGFFFPSGGGVEFEFEFDAAAARSKSSSNCSGASSNARSNCVTASSNSSSSMWTASPDSESLFFFSGGGASSSSSSTRTPPGQNRVRTALGRVPNASSNCVTASSNSSSSIWTASPDSESLVFFPGGGVPVRVRVRAGLTMQDTKPGCSRSKSQEDHGIEWQRLSELRTLSCRHQTQ